MQPQWLFVASSGQQFTANEPDVPALVQAGQITAQTLMWREGMPQWMPAASVFPLLFSTSAAVTQPMTAGLPGVEAAATPAPAAAPVQAPAGRPASPSSATALSDAAVRRLAAPLLERKGWIKVLGVLWIIGGVLTLPAVLLGLIPIFCGLALMKLAGNIERAHAQGDFVQLEEAQQNMAKFFYLQGMLLAIYLALTVLALAVVLLTSGAFIFSGFKAMEAQDPGGTGGPTIDDVRFPDTPAPANGQ